MRGIMSKIILLQASPSVFNMKTGAGNLARGFTALVATCGGLQHCAAKRSLEFTDTNAAMDTRIRLVEFLCEKRLVVVAHAGESGNFCNCANLCAAWAPFSLWHFAHTCIRLSASP